MQAQYIIVVWFGTYRYLSDTADTQKEASIKAQAHFKSALRVRSRYTTGPYPTVSVYMETAKLVPDSHERKHRGNSATHRRKPH